jgi:hypothetical protein
MVAPLEGTTPNFHEAFTQLHLGQLRPSFKCVSRDRRDGGINSNTLYILRDSVSPRPRVDEDLGIRSITGHGNEESRSRFRHNEDPDRLVPIVTVFVPKRQNILNDSDVEDIWAYRRETLAVH